MMYRGVPCNGLFVVPGCANVKENGNNLARKLYTLGWKYCGCQGLDHYRDSLERCLWEFSMEHPLTLWVGRYSAKGVKACEQFPRITYQELLDEFLEPNNN